MRFGQVISRVVDIVDKPLWYLSLGALMVATLLTFAGVILRYIFGISYPWNDEFCCFCFIVVIYFWAGPIIRTGEHLSMEMLSSRIQSSRGKAIHSLVIYVIQLGLCIFLVKWGWDMVELDRLLGFKTMSLYFPMWLFDLVIPIGAGLIGFYSLVEVAKSVGVLITKDSLLAGGEGGRA